MKKRNKNHVSVALIIIFSVAFLITSVLFKVYGITGILAQLTGTLLGTIITAIVTLLLLDSSNSPLNAVTTSSWCSNR